MLNENLDIYSIISRPILTDKAYSCLALNKYLFFVNQNSTKRLISEAITKIFDVEVDKVNIITMQGKKKLYRGSVGRRSNTKKAIVTLKEGHSISQIKKE